MLQERECCSVWGCKEPEVILPARLEDSRAEVVNTTCVAVTFTVPPGLGGMAASYQISFSSGLAGHPDADRWPQQEAEPEGGLLPGGGDLFADPRGRALLCNLVPNLQYFLRVSLLLSDHPGQAAVGDIVTVKIPPPAPATPPPVPVVYIDLELEAVTVGTTTAKIVWRHFNVTEEKPYIDGVQLRYTVLQAGDIPASLIPEVSPFIHRDINYFRLEELQPDTRYEVEVDLIPIPATSKELYSGKRLTFTTAKHVDIYDFTPKLFVFNVTAVSAEVGWTGVPSPDQKFVNIYRLIYHSLNPNSVRDESSVFKISKIDSPKRIWVSGLEADLEYQIWLEAYLTNGKTKQSNVVQFRTESGTNSLREEQAVPAAAPARAAAGGDYYGSMVAAAIIATLALLALVVILYFYLRRHTTYTATITKVYMLHNHDQ